MGIGDKKHKKKVMPPDNWGITQKLVDWSIWMNVRRTHTKNETGKWVMRKLDGTNER